MMVARRLMLAAVLAAGIALPGMAAAQDKGSLDPAPLPPLARPDDPATPAKELFGRKTAPARLEAHTIGFYAKGFDGRIDDPKAGWKGRGIWAANGDRTPWLIEGGKGTKPLAAHFQLRPDPLAK